MTGSLDFTRDFKVEQEKGTIQGYNWELGFKLFPYVKGWMYFTTFIGFVMILLFFKYPKVARYYFLQLILYQLGFIFLPVDLGSGRLKALHNLHFMVFVSILMATDYKYSVSLMVSFLIVTFFFVHPLVWDDVGYTKAEVTEKIVISIVGPILFTGFSTIVTLVSILLAENRKRTSELQELLDWIKNGVVLQNKVNGSYEIKFSNKFSRRILKKFYEQEEDVTVEDTE